MRILFVSHSFPPTDAPLSNIGGMQRVATELHLALQGREDVALRTLALRSSWKWVELKSIPFFIGLAARLGRVAAAHHADTILFTSMTTALPLLVAGPALKKKGIRLAAIVHGLDVTDPNVAYQFAVRRLCKILDVVMPVSQATGEELMARGLAREKLEIVPNAVDLSRFEGVGAGGNDGGPGRRVGEHRLSDDTFLLVSVGRQVRRKGFVWFIEHVMPKLPERVEFWLAGDGPERENITQAIERSGLRERVRCLGKISEQELVELYRMGQLFVMPNILVPGDMEGFGVVMLEAGACGLPTLGADLEGIRDVVSEGVNGWLVPTRDADAFAAHISRFINGPTLLSSARKKTSDYVRSQFRWESTVERYLRALSSH